MPVTTQLLGRVELTLANAQDRVEQHNSCHGANMPDCSDTRDGSTAPGVRGNG
jgi:hypothetical protein